ncbi:hypothetical protein [Streptomyces pseudovenezuelae]|uniref:hypothetical protein n=1 Tax=Streptomyces pseudovenezuelae TaxID=67350 RepID=UPI002E8177A4|nr:hypothetical protein [Streptomyces pseudovenezuelae]WUA88879.1 hypothetical protein OHO81_16915 [Streptomyces pseudovenezuelae]
MTATMTTTGLAEEGGIRLFGPRGRHRKPRPRKVLLAAGGLALAAGALSLVRLTPDAGMGGFGATETDPQAAPGTDPDTDVHPGTDRATNAAATVGSVPRASPSSTTVMGGVSATPAPGVSPAPAGSATAVPLPLAAAPTTIPDALNDQAPAPAPTPTATIAPHAPATTPAPQPARTTPPPASTPTPQPTHPAQPAPGLCVPIVGLCVRQGG